MIKVNLDHTNINLEQVVDLNKIKQVHQMIFNKTGKGNDYLGWLNWPVDFDKTEYEQMKKVAKTLRNKIQALVVIGIGGSYLGCRAADEMIRGLYHQDKVELIYAGNTMSSTYIYQLVEYLKNKDFGICVISKSGTTTEPGISFRVFEKLLVDKVGINKAKELIVAITDKNKGALKQLADQKGYQRFVIPNDIGGRFSVLSPVGIFPLLVSGIDTDKIFAGALKAKNQLVSDDLTNDAYKYAAIRNYLYNKGYKTEALVSYELQLQMLTEWWKQLFGESEGKENKGLLPSSMIFSTDLHSLGQWVQEGPRDVMFETIIKINKPTYDINVPIDNDNYDGLNYLTNKTFHEINQTALKGVIQAHSITGNMPNIVLEFEKMDDEQFGYLVYFFELSLAMSAYLLDVNPFNQPGVEVYKYNMFKLLEKPGIK
ncbi:glucose-6-phosphate isomerase [Mycoplasma feriruminatoris]|uniref:Glucose-6-phosphate isomerase n=1 Tax=Mycoplasma feriruminatoris TaxID=1179777 RepID=A0AAQ3DNE3_9MOLU|nr:glucose-6-phosphate isomerase [Mycoplasma feriruminatoris]UKS54111.1 glucose-6-phosphate isomerase [Mycoplasma feriruminatoris]WFQ90992.1 glucose-6-phosphate isomerase [Mycoplasma feriruminatoris]WFQ91814.1 Glucose-6-phosphate isomerase [Mycoplasma feriruminatoris]WFQ92636.1 Glucose-6-phosphate isomerase [Mycoplasma feriruminatoris]WFQ93499.1 glucose-6-phosphate isomerase [Mycoplasma feriruminatoris]